MNAEQKARLNKIIKKIVFFLILGFSYYLLVTLTDIKITCPIKAITKKYCPGCGITRMFLALAGGDIRLAANYNLLVLCLLPFGIVWGIYRAIAYVKTNKTDFYMWENIMLVIFYLMTIAFWILRNLDQFSYLAP